MDPETEEIIKKQMEKLPTEVRSLFANPELGNKIINIGKKNGLNIEQIGILQTETYLVMLGLVHPDEYLNELKSHLKINELKADDIIDDTNKEILSGIREKLKETYEKPDKHSGEKDTAQVFKSAGIEIIGEENPLPVPEKLEIKTVHPIIMQKLSNSVQTTTVKTEHTINNLTPNATPKTNEPKIDPYREIPE